MSDAWIGSSIGNGRYKITSKLGEGGMGSVYCAWDSNLQTDVVVKVPHATRQQDPEITARFVREASSLVKLSHPHIVKIIDFGEQDGQPFAVMQFLSGGSLATRQEEAQDRDGHRQLSPDALRDWLPSIAKALDFVHGQGYLHRDVKPANILFDAHGNAFLSDFGITKFAVASQDANSGKTLTGVGMVVGTPEYMAPEVILGQSADGRLDQYGLAITVFELLAGRRPFEDGTPTAVLVQQTTNPAPDVRSFNADLPPSLSSVIRQALAKSPSERFQSCTALADAALGALSGKAQSARLKCPACQKSLRLEWKVRGRTLSCPACNAELRVADDLSALTRTTFDGGFRDTKGGTRAVVIGEVIQGHRPEIARDLSDENSGESHHSEDFWDIDPKELESDTAPITRGEVPTEKSQVVTPTPTKPTPTKTAKRPAPAPNHAPRHRPATLIGAGAVVILILATLSFLVTRAGRNGTKEAGDRRSIKVATDPQLSPAIVAPAAAADKNLSDSGAKEQHPGADNRQSPGQAPAVYDVEIDPPDARLSVDAATASISGVGPRRRVVVDNPRPQASMTLVATAEGFRELRRELTPRPGITENVALKLESIGGVAKSPPTEDRAALPGTTGPVGDLSGNAAPGSPNATAGALTIQSKLVATIGTTGAEIHSIALSPDGARIATGAADQTLQIWDARTGVLKGRLERGSDVSSVAFLRDGKRLLFGIVRQRAVEIWKEASLGLDRQSGDVRRGRPKSNSRTSNQPSITFMNDPNQELWRAVLSPDEKLLATGGNSGIVTIWDVAKAFPLRQVHHSLVEVDTRNDSSPQVSMGGFGPRSPSRGSKTRTPRSRPSTPSRPGSAILSLAFSPDGKQLACGGESGRISLCNVATGEHLANLDGHSSSVLNVAYGRDGKHIVSVSTDRSLRLWDLDQRKQSRSFETGIGEAVAFSPDGKWLAAAADDNSVRVWNVQSPNEVAVLAGHAANVRHIVFSARGNRLATSDRDRTIKIWDLHFASPSLPDSTPAPSPDLASASSSANVPEAKPTKPAQIQSVAEESGPFAGHAPGQRRDDNALSLPLVWIPAGQFRMGSEMGADHQKNEGPIDVKLTHGFWLGQDEVTRLQWERAMHTHPWSELTDDLNPVSGDRYPATHITWENAMAFCSKFTEDERKAGRLPPDWEYSLPTEAQWEYACRAGTTTSYSCGNTFEKLLEHAWFKGNLQKEHERHAHLVSSTAPNQWGLHDMHGNVSEWCRDWYVPDLPGGTNPEMSSGQGRKVIRGGNWRSTALDLRSASRTGANVSIRSSAIGFRLVVVPVDNSRSQSPTQDPPSSK